MTKDADKTYCGYVAFIGAPNVGKSTLVNALVGEKVTIVSSKVQTTRTRVLGILCEDKHQAILIDTPGIFVPKGQLDRAMVNAAWQGAEEADRLFLLIDVTRPDLDGKTGNIIKQIQKLQQNKSKLKVDLVMNKIDKISRDKLLALAAQLNEKLDFDQTFMISALKKNGLEALKKHIKEQLPESPFMYEADLASDMPMRLFAAEITREQIFRQLHQELPYAVTVETEEWENFDNGDIKIQQIIYVTRDSQKAIILGKGGQQIKRIGEKARQEIEAIMECKIHLKLFVKVDEDWQTDPERYAPWGLESV